MKAYNIFGVVILVGFFVTGCATQSELKVVRRSLETKVIDLQREVSSLSESFQQNESYSKSVRQSQADASADLVGLRDNIRQLRGTSEALKAEIMDLRSSLEEILSQDINKKFEDMSSRLTYIESFIGVGEKTTSTQEVSLREKKKGITPQGETGVEVLYNEAYSTFKSGSYEEATKKFREFLKLYPRTAYSDNAQFWIGECCYFQRDYEKAILEYDQVINNYPKGNKVPNAILKQALSFVKLGDKSSGKLLLERLTKDYPNTNTARIAQRRLTEM